MFPFFNILDTFAHKFCPHSYKIYDLSGSVCVCAQQEGLQPENLNKIPTPQNLTAPIKSHLFNHPPEIIYACFV